jgi:hypothetical protein
VSSPEPKHLSVADPASIEGSATEQQPKNKRLFDDLSLKAIAGTAAVFLGAIYAYGAIIKAGQLHGAGLVVSDTLPLVPLEQILVLGINQLLPVGVATLAIFLVAMAFLDRNEPLFGRDEDDDELSEKGRARLVWSVRAFTGAVWIWLFVAASWTSWLLLAELTVVGWYARAEHSTRRSYAIFASMAVIVFFACSAYFDPSPLPDVRLTKQDGTIVKGDLIATTGSTWYVGKGDKSWTAVQAREVERVRVTAVKKDEKESIFHAITDHRLFNLGPE